MYMNNLGTNSIKLSSKLVRKNHTLFYLSNKIVLFTKSGSLSLFLQCTRYKIIRTCSSKDGL